MGVRGWPTGPLTGPRRWGNRGGHTVGPEPGWEGRLGPWARIERGESCFPFPFVCFFISKPFFQIHFKICLKCFQTLVKIIHLKNKMHQHDLHTIVAKPYDKFYFKAKYYSSYILMSAKIQN